MSDFAAEIILEPGRTERNYWRDIWRYRELFQVLAWRDITVRYKQTAIGVAWAVIRPFITMVIFTVVFGRLAKLPSEGTAPYALMVFAGLLPWTFFSSAISDASASLVANASLISKVYFPRLIIPAATVMVAFVDLLVSLGLLALVMVWYRFVPSWHIVFLPLFIFLAFLTSIGPSLWLTAVTVRYRDFRFVVPFIAQFGLYISPVGFSSTLVPEKWRLLYSLNPMVGIIDGFRWSILGGASAVDGVSLTAGSVITILLLWAGVRKFRRLEKTFADLI